MEKKYKKIIIFDMDGTLYHLNGNGFRDTLLYRTIIENTISYIADELEKNKLEAKDILDSILKKYGRHTSLGIEKELGINRRDYFNFAWNIEVENHIQFDGRVKPLLVDLKNDFDLVLLSAAPRIWIDRVLEYLQITEVFEGNIFSGEGDISKSFGNAFEEICNIKNIEAGECISIGDQEETDIIPAKKLGMKTIFVGNSKSVFADHSIRNIFELTEIFK